MSINRISHITVYVEDQQKAMQWYCEKLGFEVCMDNEIMVAGLRWLTVSPTGNADTQVVLLLAKSDVDRSRIGSNLVTVLSCDDCRAELALFHSRGVEIVEQATDVPWGVSGIFRDLYGNPYNLVGPK